MLDPFDALTDEALLGYLTGAAVEREERLVIEERDGEWVAETRTKSGLGGEVVLVDDDALTLPEEAVILGADRRTAMLRLAHLLAGTYG
jgi:hypothetical protein